VFTTLCGLPQEDGIGVARLKESPLSEAKIMPECRDCPCLSADDGHRSVTSLSVAVLTTSCVESTSSVNLSCCSKAIFRFTCRAQSKEAHTVRPSTAAFSMSRPSASPRPYKGSFSASVRKRPSRFLGCAINLGCDCNSFVP
jgi:hypothetical protein